MASLGLLGGADMILDILECSNTPKKLSTVTICPSILPNQCIVTVKQSHNQCKTSSGQAETHKFKYPASVQRSEEHTSELQSPDHLVCRLLLEKKKKKKTILIDECISLTA